MRSPAKLLLYGLLATSVTAGADGDIGSELRCRAVKIKPSLDFEYRFVMGYWFSVPVRQFWGGPVGMDLEIEVHPVNGTPGKSNWMDNRLQAEQAVPQGTRGDLHFSTGVSAGPGEYRIDWRIRDDSGRSCEGSDEFRAALSRSDRSVAPALQPGEIFDTRIYLFRPEEATPRPFLHSPRRLKVLVSLDVLGRRGRPVRPRLTHWLPLFAALRQLGRSTSFNEFSVVVFSFEDRKVLLRHDYRDVFDFPSLRGVVGGLEPETVDVSALMQGSEMRFFEELLSAELLGPEAPDSVVFLGREMSFGKRLHASSLERFRRTGATFAFFDASRYVWRGAIGNVVRAMDGKEYRLGRPADLAKALKGLEKQVLRARAQ